jgi:hypothetical protein
MEKRYEITIKEIGQERKNIGMRWVPGAGENGAHGYAPEVVTVVDYEREIYSQTIGNLDLGAVILAVNGK